RCRADRGSAARKESSRGARGDCGRPPPARARAPSKAMPERPILRRVVPSSARRFERREMLRERRTHLLQRLRAVDHAEAAGIVARALEIRAADALEKSV